MAKKYDFCGWASKNDLLCSDGRVIRRNAFKHNHGKKVPLLWNHDHNDPDNVLGHAMLENRNEGMYAYGYFNDSDRAQHAKTMLEHGDITNLSIFANHLKQRAENVLHGDIKEVSLVLAGANPGAYIESVMAHGDSDEDGFSAILYTDEDICLYHGEDDYEDEYEYDEEDNNNLEEGNMEEERTVQDVFDELTEEQKKVVYYLIGQAVEEAQGGNVQHADIDMEDATIEDIIDTMTEDQKDAMYYLIGEAVEEAEEGVEMGHNAFEDNEEYLSHSDMSEFIENAKRNKTSLKQAFIDEYGEDASLEHADVLPPYGIDNLDYLFPEAKAINKTPDFIKRRTEWVATVMNGVHHTPFSRIKSVHADITMDEARAKGYLKGTKKVEEVFTLLRRTTDPQTIYKKQKLDRDDVLDITDMDVVSWLRGEMRIMMDEEIGRAILIGDQRLVDDPDKINPTHVRPIWTDDTDVYVINKVAELGSSATEEDIAKAVQDHVILGLEDYEGSGDPVMFCTKRFLTRSLLIRNGIGERMFKSVSELADSMGVSKIVTVPLFNNVTRTVDGQERTLQAIVVNLTDYNVGADKGGELTTFNDFDIDFNQEKYLMETRISGALIKPKSAIVVETAFL